MSITVINNPSIFSMNRYAKHVHASFHQQDCQLWSPNKILLNWHRQGHLFQKYLGYAYRYLFLGHLLPQEDILHFCDHGYAHLLSPHADYKQIITFHDAVNLIAAKGDIPGFTPSKSSLNRQRANLEHLQYADLIFCDSLCGANFLINQNIIATEKIITLPLAVEDTYFKRISPSTIDSFKKMHALDGKKIMLHVGSNAPQKNHEGINQIAKNILKEHNSILIRVGEKNSAYNLPSERHKIFSNIDDNTLKLLYQCTDITLMPSWYEGFGWPALESMASGTPVVASNQGALPEILENHGATHEPDDIHSLTQEALDLIDNDNPYRLDLIEHARKFSMENFQKKLRQSYIENGIINKLQ